MNRFTISFHEASNFENVYHMIDNNYHNFDQVQKGAANLILDERTRLLNNEFDTEGKLYKHSRRVFGYCMLLSFVLLPDKDLFHA